MWDDTRDLKTSVIVLRDGPSSSERERIIGLLLAKLGVRGATRTAAATQRLVVKYDAEVVTCPEIVSFLRVCGIPARMALPTDG
jgi:hypothetical protein